MSAAAKAALLTGVGLAVPGLTGAEDLLGATPGHDPFDPATGLRGREMRNKDRASRLALRAADAALDDAGLLDERAFRSDADRTAVIVSCNLGTLDSVCRFTDTIACDTVTGLSALGLPETSSNVVAGWIAIRYALRGPSLTLCNGSTSGLDALFWARNLIAAGRADAVVVVGVEPASGPASRLLGEHCADAAAAVIVESRAAAESRAAPPRAALAGYARGNDLEDTIARASGARTPDVALWLAGRRDRGPDDAASRDWQLPAPLDLEARLGPCSGALGVLQCAAAVAYIAGGGAGAVLATAGGGADSDATCALLVTRTALATATWDAGGDRAAGGVPRGTARRRAPAAGNDSPLTAQTLIERKTDARP